MQVQPRLKVRNLLRKNLLKVNIFKKDIPIEQFLKKISNKDTILDYSQLRIGLFHLLSKEVPHNSFIATTCYTIFDILNVVINAGHKPILVDIDEKNLCPNLEELIFLVNSKKVKAVIFTHLHGYNVPLNKSCRSL